MKITVVGGHGSVAMLMHPMLINNGHQVRGIIRKEKQADDLQSKSVEPVICDIEEVDDISEAVGEVDAVVFAAGAGPGSGKERKFSVDRDGAIKLIEAAKNNGIKRYVMISAMDVENPRGNEVFRAYLKAKAEADEALRNSELDYTIVKPGGLTDNAGTGRVTIASDLPSGEIPREDVAAVLTKVLETPETAGYEFNVTSGNMPIVEAVENMVKS